MGTTDGELWVYSFGSTGVQFRLAAVPRGPRSWIRW